MSDRRNRRPWEHLTGGLRTDLVFSLESVRVNVMGLLVAATIGILIGTIGGAFSLLLDKAADVRGSVPYLTWLLPLAGLPVVWMYRRGGIRTAGGTDLIVEAARGEQPVSRLLAPVIFAATLLTHLFGGSAGREGAALQLGGSLAESIRKELDIGDEFEDLIIMCGMAAGFSSVFGNQIGAAFFALEISCVGMLPLGALFPCVISSLSAGVVARAIGAENVKFTLESLSPTPVLYGKVLLLAILCGIVSIIVCRVFTGTGPMLAQLIPNPWARVIAGGIAVTAISTLLGTQAYLGSGQSMINAAVGSGQAAPWDWIFKLLLTAITLGAGFKGGEIVPSFAIGATFGCVIGPLLGLPPELSAAIGMISMFCGVTNCPITSLMLGFEVFSFAMPGAFLIAVAASFLVSGYSGLYAKQKFAFAKEAGREGTAREEEDHRLRM